jgi:hypothetical protein
MPVSAQCPLTAWHCRVCAEQVSYILHGSIGRLLIFHRLSPSFKLAIFPLLKPINYAPTEVIFSKGAESQVRPMGCKGGVPWGARALRVAGTSHGV